MSDKDNDNVVDFVKILSDRIEVHKRRETLEMFYERRDQLGQTNEVYDTLLKLPGLSVDFVRSLRERADMVYELESKGMYNHDEHKHLSNEEIAAYYRKCLKDEG